MDGMIGAVALAALLVWLFARKRARPTPAPEDDVETPVDADELAEAERELAEDDGARPLKDGDDDDWGPGRA